MEVLGITSQLNLQWTVLCKSCSPTNEENLTDSVKVAEILIVQDANIEFLQQFSIFCHKIKIMWLVDIEK